MFNGEEANTYLIMFGDSNPRFTALEASMLTITPPMWFIDIMCIHFGRVRNAKTPSLPVMYLTLHAHCTCVIVYSVQIFYGDLFT
jgi:hypothetical protein